MSPPPSSTLSLASALLLGSSLVSAAQNFNNPLKKLAHRSITQSVEDVNGEKFDFVIAGGGLAGLALAARLTEWSNLTVAVIEAGPTGSEAEFKDRIDIPGNSYLNGLTQTDFDWQYTTEVQPNANSTTKYWPRGKGLGGSGSINGMFWSRGGAEDYDAWDTLNPGSSVNWKWSGDDGMQHYINKAENFTAPRPDQATQFGIEYDTSVHGTIGPIQAGYCAYIYDSISNWVPTWQALGFSRVDGHSGKNHGVSITPMTLNPTNQSRSDSKAGYIDPLPPRSNLVILTGYQATAVFFNGTKDANGSVIASGLEFMSTAGGATGTKYTVSATKEVILAGGVVGSPQILQLSGVGPKSLLNSLGIPVVVDLPVGFNLQDHISTTIDYTVPAGTHVWGNLLDKANASTQLANYKNGDYANSEWTYVNEATGYVSMADITPDYTKFASDAVSALTADVQAMKSASSVPDSVAAGYAAQYAINNEWLLSDVGQLEIIMTMLAGTSGVGIQAGLQHPYSRGTIMIRSKSAFDKPLINPNYYGIEKDIEILQFGIEFARKLARTSPMSDLMITESTPGLTVTDGALTTWIKTSSGTEYHPLGTCSMQPQANGGVVDTHLVVYGTSNLRVVDASIMPLQLSAHLMASTYGIAEKAADLIKAKHTYIAPVVSSTSASASSTAAASPSPSSTSNGTAAGGNVAAATTSSSMSSGTRNVVIGAVAGGVGAIALGLIALMLVRKKKRADRAVKTQSFYVGSTGDDAWETGYHNNDNLSPYAAAAAGGGASAVRLDTLAGRSSENLQAMAPPAALLGRGERSASVSSMATAEMSGAQPMMASGSHGGEGGGGWYQPAATNDSYHDESRGYNTSNSYNDQYQPQQGYTTNPGEVYHPQGQAHQSNDQHRY